MVISHYSALYVHLCNWLPFHRPYSFASQSFDCFALLTLLQTTSILLQSMLKVNASLHKTEDKPYTNCRINAMIFLIPNNNASIVVIFIMKYETFLKEKERIANFSVQEQKDFYAHILEEEQSPSAIRLQAYFQYAVLFYYEGNFQKTIEILEPFTISYQSYEYIPEMLSCFNLMGVALQCEGEYALSRYYYTLALKIVKEYRSPHHYAYEYNNISLTYIAEQNYEEALHYIQLAEKALPLSDNNIGAFIYLNKSDIYNHFNEPDKAVQAFETSIHQYNGLEILPDDTLICGVSLFYKLGDHKKYSNYISQLLEKLSAMYPSEFIDACNVIFDCSLDSGNYALVDEIIKKMDSYIQTYPDENQVGLKIEHLKYLYAEKINDREAMLKALQAKDHYYALIVAALEQHRIVSMDEYLETHKHLQDAVENEIQANRSKTQFLSNISHDIRTPMNAIVGITNLMTHALYNPEKLEGYLSKIQLSSRHMLGLINDLLDMNKIESGTTHLNAEPMNLPEQINQIHDLIHTQASEKEQSFEIISQDIFHENLIADATRLRQVLLNILSNAVKYTPAGGKILFHITELNDETYSRARYRFTIEDTGIGMDQDLLEHVFDPFIRGEDSVVNKIQGTGLGMAITKNIIDLMEGSIHIDSEVNKGTCVTVILEFDIDQNKDAHEPVSETNANTESSDGMSILNGMHFLCAEDNELNAEILVETLEIVGASCTVYTNGAEIVKAFESVDSNKYNAILMDIQMPVMNGYEATKRIRNSQNPLGRTIPIIAMTANAFVEDIKKSFAVGMNAHLSKPLDMAELEKTIRRLKS